MQPTQDGLVVSGQSTDGPSPGPSLRGRASGPAGAAAAPQHRAFRRLPPRPAPDHSPRRFRHLGRPIVTSENKRPASSARQVANPAARYPSVPCARTQDLAQSVRGRASGPAPACGRSCQSRRPPWPRAHFLPDAVTCAALCPTAAGQWRWWIRRANGR